MMNKIVQIDGKFVKNNLIYLKQIIFEVTEKCNLNCKYCGLSDLYQSYEIRSNRDLPFTKVKLMIDYLSDIWKNNEQSDTVFRTAVGFYGGEPLINITLIKQIINYIEQMKIPGRKFHYTMTTNAMLLDKYMDFLAEKDFKLLISLDGDEKAQSYRVDHAGNNSFNQVLRNVKLLQSVYPDYFNESVRFASVLHNRNDVDTVYDFFKTNLNVTPHINLLNDSGVREDKKEEFKKMYKNKSQSISKLPNCEAIEDEYFLETPKGYRLTRYLYHLSGNIFLNYNELLLQKLENYEVFTGTCTPFSKKLFISADGKILQCERIDHDFVLGFVHDDFVELNCKYVAERHNYYLSKYAKQCVCCATNKLCPQCIYQIDDIRNESPYCHYFFTEKTSEINKEQIYDYLRQHPHYYEKVLNEVRFNI